MFVLRAVQSVAGTETFPAADDRWQYYKSPHFELYSRNGDTESRQFLHDLELLQAVFTDRFHFVPKVRLDVTAFYFRSLEDFRAYLPATLKSEVVGYYMAGLDRATIAVAPADDFEDARAVVFHELVHHFFRAFGEDVSVWYNEGTADLLSSLKPNGSRVELGWPSLGRIAPVRNEKLMPLETLFSVDGSSPIYRSGEHTGLFYAESWALLHYWLYGDSKIPREAVNRFLHVAGHPDSAAKVGLRTYFRDCFGMDYPDMLKRLSRYVHDGDFAVAYVPMPKLDSPDSYTVRPVPLDEIRLRLAELSLRCQRSPAAKLALLNAAQANPPDVRALETLGNDAMVEQDQEAARSRWEAAIAAGSQNVAIYRELGLMESRLWFQEFNYDFRLSDEIAERLRDRLLKSIGYEPLQTAPYEMLAWVEAYAHTPSLKNVMLVQKHFAGLKEQARTVIALALVREHLGKPDEAKSVLAQLPKLPADEWSAYAAEIMRAKIDGRSTAGIHPRTGREKVQEIAAAQRSGLPYPSVELPEGL